jgi:hypothetical protein
VNDKISENRKRGLKNLSRLVGTTFTDFHDFVRASARLGGQRKKHRSGLSFFGSFFGQAKKEQRIKGFIWD